MKMWSLTLKKQFTAEVEAESRKKAEEITANLNERCENYINEIEAHVEKTKDETVVLTCELGEHSSI